MMSEPRSSLAPTSRPRPRGQGPGSLWPHEGTGPLPLGALRDERVDAPLAAGELGAGRQLSPVELHDLPRPVAGACTGRTLGGRSPRRRRSTRRAGTAAPARASRAASPPAPARSGVAHRLRRGGPPSGDRSRDASPSPAARSHPPPCSAPAPTPTCRAPPLPPVSATRSGRGCRLSRSSPTRRQVVHFSLPDPDAVLGRPASSSPSVDETAMRATPFGVIVISSPGSSLRSSMRQRKEST